MKKVYYDMSDENLCAAIYVPDAVVIPAGTSISPVSAIYKNAEYQKFAEDYDIYFIFDDEIPSVNFYTVPQVDIFAKDSQGGWLGKMYGDNGADIGVCYIDESEKCYLVAESTEEFLKIADSWKEKLTLHSEIVF